jgi:hypothetical protein
MLAPPVAMVLADSSLGGRQQVQALSGSFFPAYVTLPRQAAGGEECRRLLALSGLRRSVASKPQQAFTGLLRDLKSRWCDAQKS